MRIPTRTRTRLSDRLRRPALVGSLIAVVLAAGCTANTTDSAITVTVDPPVQAAPTQILVPGLNHTPSPSSQSGAVSTADVAAARYTLTPRTGSTDIGPNEPVSVTVFAATITDITLTAADGSRVPGQLDPTGSTWTASDRLDYNTTYTFDGAATTQAGQDLPIDGSFTTVNPQNPMNVQINIPDGGVVGIAAPIIVTFAAPVINKAEVERALEVSTSLGAQIEGNWGWVQDEDFQGMGVQSQVHWRPTATPFPGDTPYWPAGTAVTVNLKLKGVSFGNNYWGKSDLTSSFTIRPDAQIVKADVSTFRLVVQVDGQTVKDYPVSYGLESVPGRATTNGIHIVTEKFPEFSMCNLDFGYCNVNQKWAVRINNNGEFIHENMANAANLGVRNSSHGCVNMGDPDAKEYYDSAMFGDPVEITNAAGPPMSEKDALYNWIYSSQQWKDLSVLT